MFRSLEKSKQKMGVGRHEHVFMHVPNLEGLVVFDDFHHGGRHRRDLQPAVSTISIQPALHFPENDP